MGGLALALPVSAAFVTHGLLQLVANGWRAVLHRQHVDWKIVGIYAVGSLTAGAVVSLIALTPSKAALYLFMGLLPALLWLPQSWIRLDAARPGQALLAETGLHPPGAWVKLACGETALVMKRQSNPRAPLTVVSLINRDGMPLGAPAVRHTALPKFKVEAGVPSGEIRLQPNLEALQKLV